MIAFPSRIRTVIDDVRLDDADALADLHGDSFSRAWSANDFAGLIREATVFGVAARHQTAFRPRRVVGFALVRAVADEAEVLSLAVHASHRRRGVGRQMMEEVLRRLYRERMASCFLEVDRENPGALRLYRSLGFAVVGERKGYYPQAGGSASGALVMRLHLR